MISWPKATGEIIMIEKIAFSRFDTANKDTCDIYAENVGFVYSAQIKILNIRNITF